MRFACESCLTRYTLADEKVRGRILKIRCKTCGTIMEVKDPALAAREATAFDEQATKAIDPSEAMRLAGGADQAAADSWENQATRSMPVEEAMRLARRTEPAASAEWFAMRRGEQLGPMPAAELERKLAIGELGPRSYVWRDGMVDWQRLEEVEELAALAGAATGEFVPTPGPLAGAAQPVEPPAVAAEATPAQALPSQLDAASLFDMPEASGGIGRDEPAAPAEPVDPTPARTPSPTPVAAHPPVSARADDSRGGAWALQGSGAPVKSAPAAGRSGGSRLLKLVGAGVILAAIVAAGFYFLVPAGTPAPDEAAPAQAGTVRIGELPTEGYPPLGPVALREALGTRLGGFQRCAADHEGAGRIVVRAVVAPSGVVTTASADKAGPLGACLADRTRDIRFPAFQGEPIEISVPIEIPPL